MADSNFPFQKWTIKAESLTPANDQPTARQGENKHTDMAGELQIASNSHDVDTMSEETSTEVLQKTYKSKPNKIKLFSKSQNNSSLPKSSGHAKKKSHKPSLLKLLTKLQLRTSEVVSTGTLTRKSKEDNLCNNPDSETQTSYIHIPNTSGQEDEHLEKPSAIQKNRHKPVVTILI